MSADLLFRLIPPLRDSAATGYCPSTQTNLPWPLFFKRGSTMGDEELRNACKKIPLFFKGE